jgi:NAD(P)-dependent dehydrogenase (short-subunit alcohol dehydrogenase family)
MHRLSPTFEGKTILVAGGTGGLGRAVSLAFLEARAHVAATYRKADEYRALEEAAGAARVRLSGHEVDVTDESAARGLGDAILAGRGRLDALINTVGGWTGGRKLWEADAGAFDAMLTVNLRAGVALCRAIVPLMVRQGSGAVVNVASRSGVAPGPGEAAYAASKAAAVAMIASLAEDLKGSGVRANSVLPSIIDTDANRRAMPKADFAKWPKAEDIARVILFLCSEDARLVHGAAIPVYGAA